MDEWNYNNDEFPAPHDFERKRIQDIAELVVASQSLRREYTNSVLIPISSAAIQVAKTGSSGFETIVQDTLKIMSKQLETIMGHEEAIRGGNFLKDAQLNDEWAEFYENLQKLKVFFGNKSPAKVYTKVMCLDGINDLGIAIRKKFTIDNEPQLEI